MSETKTSVPKFGSFKPKPIPAVQDRVEEKDRLRRGKHGSDESRSHNDHHRLRKPHSKERRRDRSKGRHQSDHGRLVERRHLTPPSKDETVEIFIIDRKGDLNNLVYGSVHLYSIPPFHRAGAGSVLGIPSSMRIDRDYGDEKGIILHDRREIKSNDRGKYIFSKIEKERPRLLRIRPELKVQGSIVDDIEFVSLSTSRGNKRKRGLDGESSDSDNGKANYRSIHGKAKARKEPKDEDFQYVTESESSGSETGRNIKLDTSTRQRTVELSRKVEQHPHDITAWLALIDHQDTLIHADGDQQRITNAEIRSTAEIKLHMFETALEKAWSLQDRESLLLGLMAEGAKVWEVKTQSDRWEQISKDNIDSLVLWRSYLNFKQTTFGTFQYEEVRDIFAQRIKLLLKAAQVDGAYALYHQVVYVLLRFTTFLYESGYGELSVAIWQGVLEFNIFAPSKSLEDVEKINLFKQFWESEVPRIGEDTALGWSHFVGNEGELEASDPTNDEEGNLLDDRHVFKSWAIAEQTRSKVSRLPARTLDEVVEDDPFRLILVSDIEDFLVPFPSESDEIRSSLLNAFLAFCLLPPTASSDKASWDWSRDPFVGGALLGSTWAKQPLMTGSSDTNSERKLDIYSMLGGPSTNFQNSPESMFGISWFKSMEAWRDINDGDNGPVQYKFLQNVITQLHQVSLTQDVAEYFLAFEWRNEPKTIKKVSRSLFKRHPASLRLYNAYGIIEWSRENREAANGVFSAALDMAKTMTGKDKEPAILLWKSWTWAYLEATDNAAALQRLLSIESGVYNNDVGATPFQLLKTKQHLSQQRDYHLYSAKIEFSIIYAECLALVEYLSTNSSKETQSNAQGNITAALSVYTSFSRTLTQALKDRSIDASLHELFLQSAARLLYHHARVGPFRPALLREHLAIFLTLFPQNTIFLSLYTFNESRLRIDNRVRTVLSSTVLIPPHDVLISRVSAIYYELSYGTIHSTRSAFERALSASSSKYSARLWKLYILYCLQIPQFKLHIKDVWYRALRTCPWAKELFIVGFEHLGDEMEFVELKNTWRVMGEKGLRVHVDLEDKFDEIAVPRGRRMA